MNHTPKLLNANTVVVVDLLELGEYMIEQKYVHHVKVQADKRINHYELFLSCCICFLRLSCFNLLDSVCLFFVSVVMLSSI